MGGGFWQNQISDFQCHGEITLTACFGGKLILPPIRKCDKVIPVDGGDPGKGGAFGQNKGSLLGSILPTGQHLQGVEIGTYIMSWYKVRKPESLIEYSHL